MSITVKTLKETYDSYYSSLLENGITRTHRIFSDFEELLDTLDPNMSITDCASDIVDWMNKYKVIPLFDFIMIQHLAPYSQIKRPMDRQLASYMETCYIASIFPRYTRFELSKMEIPFYIRARNYTPLTHMHLGDPEYPENAADLLTWAKLNDKVYKEFKAMHIQMSHDDQSLDISKTIDYLMKCSDEKIFFIWRAATRMTLLLATDSVVYHRAFPITSWYMRMIMYIMDQRRTEKLSAFKN